MFNKIGNNFNIQSGGLSFGALTGGAGVSPTQATTGGANYEQFGNKLEGGGKMLDNQFTGYVNGKENFSTARWLA